MPEIRLELHAAMVGHGDGAPEAESLRQATMLGETLKAELRGVVEDALERKVPEIGSRLEAQLCAELRRLCGEAQSPRRPAMGRSRVSSPPHRGSRRSSTIGEILWQRSSRESSPDPRDPEEPRGSPHAGRREGERGLEALGQVIPAFSKPPTPRKSRGVADEAGCKLLGVPGMPDPCLHVLPAGSTALHTLQVDEASCSERKQSPEPQAAWGSGEPCAQDQEQCSDSKSSQSLHSRPDTRAVAQLVKSQYFDWAVCALILLNATSIGVQTDYVARTNRIEVPAALRAVEMVFCVLFTFELALRLWVYRLRFFYMHGWQWNLFDCMVVSLQLAEELLSAAQLDSSESLNFSFTRVLRILRLIRVMRIARILRLIRELRTLVASISNSLRSLGWTVLLLLLMIYSVSLYLTQLVSDHQMGAEEGGASSNSLELEFWYGSVLRSMLTLFEAISGGIDWDTVVRPLTEEISPLLAFMFALYIAFSVLAMMNVVTGVFVESVLQSAKADKDSFVINNAREIFNKLDHGTMTEEDFGRLLETAQMQEFFKGMDVNADDAQFIFRLMDTDRSGQICAQEFLDSCIRLRGPARALECAMLIQELRRVRSEVQRSASLERHVIG